MHFLLMIGALSCKNSYPLSSFKTLFAQPEPCRAARAQGRHHFHVSLKLQ